MAKKKKNDKVDKKKPGAFWKPQTVVLMVMLGFMFASPGTFMVMLIGMAPSLMMSLVQPGAGQQQKSVMIALNAAAVIPFAALVLAADDSFKAALSYMTDLYVIALIYGAAASSLALMWGTSKAASAVIDVFARNRARHLRAEQAEMKDEFGPELELDAARFLSGELVQGTSGGEGEEPRPSSLPTG